MSNRPSIFKLLLIGCVLSPAWFCSQSILLGMQGQVDNASVGNVARERRTVEAYASMVHKQIELLRVTVPLGESEVTDLKKRTMEELNRTQGENLKTRFAREQVAKIFFETALNEVEGEKRGEIELAQRDWNLRQANRDSEAQGAVIYVLDSLLTLTAKQEIAIREQFAKHWQSAWNRGLATVSLSGFEPIKRLFDHLDVEASKLPGEDRIIDVLLNREQRDLFQRACNRSRAELADREDWAPLREFARRVMIRRVDEIDEICKLDERQRKVLSIAVKGAVRKLVYKWENALEQSVDLESSLNGTRLAVTPIVDQIEREPRWSETLRKVLSEDQRQKWFARQRTRRERKEAVAKGYALLFIERYVELTHSQTMEFQVAMQKKVIQSGANEIVDVVIQFFLFRDEDFMELMSEDQWEKCKNEIRQQREGIKGMIEEQERLDALMLLKENEDQG